MKSLRRLYFGLIYALPAVLFCSYYPIIRLGSSDSMNFELSLPLIWLVLFDFAAFILMLKNHTNNRSLSDRRFFLFSLFPFYATLSIFWSANPIRAVLTAGIIWLLFFAIFALLFITPLLTPPKNFRANLLKSFLTSSIVICIFCWLQSILDLLGFAREHTLLCLGCVSETFGFPHPSGLAIEPQFMGNLLLAPTLLSLYLLTFRDKSGVLRNNNFSKRPSATNGERNERRVARNESRRSPSEERISSFFRGDARESERSEDGPTQACRVKNYYLLYIIAFIFASTLFLTFSRGAIYAFAVALVVLFIFALTKRQFRAALIIIPAATFVFVLIMQGIFNAVGPTHGNFCSGVAKSLNQLSLGIIDIRSACPVTPAQTSMANQIMIEQALPEEIATEIVAQTQSTFDGYVAESTDVRLGLNSVALQTWSVTPSRILFGVGLGAAGTAMHSAFPATITTPKEIVQNQPISLLLELGIVGVMLILFSLLIAFCPQLFSRKFLDGRSATAKPLPSFWRHPALPLLLSLIIAYLVTLQFFSGLPNALQIYLLPPFLYYVLSRKENYCNTEPVEV